MAAFNPQLIQDPRLLKPAGMPAMPELPPVAPPPVEPAPPAFIPQPLVMPPPPPKRSPMNVSPEVARKAQGIYPAEQQAKQAMMDNAKAMPTPTGAWGAPA